MLEKIFRRRRRLVFDVTKNHIEEGERKACNPVCFAIEDKLKKSFLCYVDTHNIVISEKEKGHSFLVPFPENISRFNMSWEKYAKGRKKVGKTRVYPFSFALQSGHRFFK